MAKSYFLTFYRQSIYYLQIDVGLAFYHVTSKLEIHILSASKLKICNKHDGLSDPYVKIKVFDDQKSKEKAKWEFETHTIWGTLNPRWNLKYVLIPKRINYIH